MTDEDEKEKKKKKKARRAERRKRREEGEIVTTSDDELPWGHKMFTEDTFGVLYSVILIALADPSYSHFSVGKGENHSLTGTNFV